MNARDQGPVDWPTLLLLVACYAVWGLGITWLSTVWLPLAIVVTAVAITLHSSLQHEVLHGHPFRIRLLNEATVFLPLGLVFPYGRFRDSHLAHHRDEFLTDPYDDPESNFQDPEAWAHMARPLRWLLRFNNTLLGRMVVGPAVGAIVFWYNQARFGSGFEFGATYSLTTNDMNHRGFNFSRVFRGLYSFLLQPPVIHSTFPFLESWI